MEKLRCLVVDDEGPARKLTREYIDQLPFLEWVASCRNAFEAMEVLQREDIDLMFLDIQMPGMTGTTFLSGLRQRPMVIFITAYDQYAAQSYDLDVIDYLVKPVSMERFTRAAYKAIQARQGQVPSNDTAAPASKEEAPDHFFVYVEYALVKVVIGDITHIEGMKDYVKIYLSTADKPLLTKSTLKGMEEKLSRHRFMRVHKSFIVHLDKIESVRGHQIVIGKHEIPVSPQHMDALMQVLKGE